MGRARSTYAAGEMKSLYVQGFQMENMREIGDLEDPDIDERFPKVRGIS